MAGGMPKNRYLMKRAYYEFKAARRCNDCGEPIEWWLTTNKKSVPFNAPQNPEDEREEAVCHWATCTKKKAAKAKPEQPRATKPALTREQLIQRRDSALDNYHASSGALIVVAIFEEGKHFAYAIGLDGEDARNSIIAAANLVRADIQNLGGSRNGAQNA